MDDETFQKLVERQYEMLRKERMKGLEEQKPKPEENGGSITEPPAATAAATTNNNEDAQPPPPQEVLYANVANFCFTDKRFQLTIKTLLLKH